MERGRLIVEFWQFLREERLYWLVPVVFLLIFLALLLMFSAASPLGPFLYPLF
jgi:hypothetical protein